MTTQSGYYAFISYSRKDKVAAAWLQRQLEKFRYPAKLVPDGNRPSHPVYIRKIFLDKNELESTNESFKKEIERSLSESRYLIALCSKNFASSRWCNEEIEFFLRTHGNDISKVIPVFLEGENIDDVFCPKLAEFSDELKSRNLPDMRRSDDETQKESWENGFVQTVSYMLKVSRTKISNRFQQEKHRVLRIVIFWTLMALACFVFLTIWAMHAEQKARASEARALASEAQAKISERKAIASEAQARESEQKARASEKRALASEARALKSESEAKASEKRALASEERALKSEKTARAAEKNARISEALAKDNERQTAQTFDFLRDVLISSDPSRKGNKDTTIIQAMNSALGDIEKIKHPKVRATIYRTIGSIFNSYGEYEKSKELMQKAIDSLSEADGKDKISVDLADAMNNMGLISYNQGDFEKAIDFYYKALESIVARGGFELF